MHPFRQFPGHFVVHMPSCSLSCRVAHLLSSNWGGEGTVTWGRFPRRCEGTVAPSRLLDKGGGRVVAHQSGSKRLHCGGVSHCITWFQTQLILTMCQIRYRSHLWDHRSTGQL